MFPRQTIQHLNIQSQTIQTPEVTGKFGLEVENKAGQRLTEFLSREHTGHSKYPLPPMQEMTVAQIMNPLLQNSDLN